MFFSLKTLDITLNWLACVVKAYQMSFIACSQNMRQFKTTLLQIF